MNDYIFDKEKCQLFDTLLQESKIGYGLGTGKDYLVHLDSVAAMMLGFDTNTVITLDSFSSVLKIDSGEADLKTVFDQMFCNDRMHMSCIVQLRGRTSLDRFRLVLYSQHTQQDVSDVYFLIQSIKPFVKIRTKVLQEYEVLERTFDESSEGLAFVSIKGDFFRVNHKICSMLGYTQDELLDKTLIEFVHPEDIQELKSIFQKFNQGTIQKYVSEKRYLHKNGSLVWTSLMVALLRDDDGKPLHFIVQISDITELHQSNNRITSLLQKTTDQNKRLVNFTHIVSHNLRSHSGNMVMLMDLIREEYSAIMKDPMFVYLQQSIGKLEETIADLNEVIMVYSFKESQIYGLALYDYVVKTIAILKPTINASNAIIENLIPKNCTVPFIPAYLESVLLNLISNALKYKSPLRTPKIRLSITQDSNFIVLTVSDNGIGIDLEKHGHKIFGMYKTFHNHPDSRGIGLFLIKNQIEALRGHISVASEPDSGTTFTIFFRK